MYQEEPRAAVVDPLTASRKNCPSPAPLEQRLGVSPVDYEEEPFPGLAHGDGEALKALNSEGLRCVFTIISTYSLRAVRSHLDTDEILLFAVSITCSCDFIRFRRTSVTIYITPTSSRFPFHPALCIPYSKRGQTVDGITVGSQRKVRPLTGLHVETSAPWR